MPASAQTGQSSVSREVVQPLPDDAAITLNSALRRLSSDPTDLSALLRAGRASLKLGDVDAAMGFFTRADDLGETHGEARAGLAAVQVYKKRPLEALELFAKAEQEGASLDPYARDRGLAYDLVGDNARAQALYREVLSRGKDDEVLRRLALSFAIAGDRQSMEDTLLPLLEAEDLASFRTRAFGLAAMGNADEAVEIVNVVMPPSLSGRISPYLRYMPRLTRAQQAAAGNFGHFPEAESIGKDDPRIAQIAADTRGNTRNAASGDRLVPKGEPLGNAASSQTRVAQAEPQQRTGVIAQSDLASQRVSAPPRPSGAAPGLSPSAQTVTSPSQSGPPARAAGEIAPIESSRAPTLPAPVSPGETPASPRQAPVSSRPAQASTATPTPGPAPTPEMFLPQQAAAPPASAPPASAPPAAAPPQPQPSAPQLTQTPPAQSPQAAPPATRPEPVSLAQAFSGFQLPNPEAEAEPGAVDITTIEPPREIKEPPKPVHPRRFWVQVATGADRGALRWDWRRITREADSLMDGKKGYLADWGRTNRLLTGPFDSEGEARDFVNELKDAGIDSFPFNSAEGEAIDPLPPL